MSIHEFFIRYKCTRNEKEHLLDHLCAIRVKRVIKEIDNLKSEISQKLKQPNPLFQFLA